jgi:hypothetical protein
MAALNLDETTEMMAFTLTTPVRTNVRKFSPVRSIGRNADAAARMAARREGRR